MRCQGCDYPLWNLKARQCPECGRPFAPTQFEFVPNSVRFCCPDCGQDYYGTGDRGHLVPDRFDCVRCSRPLAMDEMVLLPTAGVEEERTRVDHNPWIERRKIGFFRAWGGTIWRVMFNPGQLARLTPADASAWAAWWFAVITIAAALMTTFVPFLVMMLVFSPARGTGFAAASGLGGMALFCIAVAAIALPLWGVLTHLVLLISGGTQRPLSTTVRTICYSAGAAVLLAIPCVGVYLSWVAAWIWPAISAAIMLRHTQRVSGLRATLAVLTAPALLFAGFMLLMFSVIFPVVSSSATYMSTAPAMATQAACQLPLSALTLHASNNGGQYPRHAFSLLTSNELTPGQLTPPVFGPPIQRPPSILDRYDLMTDPQRQALQKQLEASLPPGGAIHRLGDFVFTYHGVDPDTADPAIWLVIYDPPATATDYSGKPVPIAVGTVGNQVITVPRDQFAARLQAQNSLRAGLPQIPDPATVKDPGDPSGGP